MTQPANTTTEMKNTAFLALGSNQGDRKGYLDAAVVMIAELCGTVKKVSGIYQTAAWGLTDQPDFLNMVVEIETTLAPPQLLSQVQEIEQIEGRQRTLKWGQRTLDIDILFYNTDIINTPGLIIPHPFVHQRRFTLVPMSEIAPGYIHPQLNETIQQLLAVCPDKLEVEKIT